MGDPLFKSLHSVKSAECTPIGVRFSTIETRLDTFLQSIEDGKLSNEEIIMHISKGFNMYTDYNLFTDSTTSDIMKRLWNNEAFVKNIIPTFERRLVDIGKITEGQVTFFNKITFHHISDNGYDAVGLILKKLCALINIRELIQFKSIMNTEAAELLLIIAKSSYKPAHKVKKLNDIIAITMLQDPNITIENIIYIYHKLYGSDFSTLFMHSMTTPMKLDHNGTDLSMQQSIITIALLTILEEGMSIPEAEKVLRQYAEYADLMHCESLRYSFKEHKESEKYFPKTTKIIESIDSSGYVIVP